MNSRLDKKVIWSHIKTLRYVFLKNNSLLPCDSNTHLIPDNHISSNVENFSKIVRIGNSSKINKNFSKSDITESAKLFLALNACPSIFVKLYWQAIYGPKERMAMLTLNIMKKAKGDFKEVALNIFAKVSTVLGFQHFSFHHKGNESVGRNMEWTKNILGIKGEKYLRNKEYIHGVSEKIAFV